MTYEKYYDMLNKPRRFPYRKLANNTYLHRRDDRIAVTYHETDVVTYHPDGTVVLDSGGWRTSTTKERLHNFSPLRVWQEDSIWYVSGPPKYGESPIYLFEDGITLHPDGSITGEAAITPRQVKALKRRINRYVDGFMTNLPSLPPPSSGDCWFCCMVTNNGKTLGEEGNTSHLESHFEEKYYVPSLLLRAMQVFPVSQAAQWYIGSIWDTSADPETRLAARRIGGLCTRQIRSSLRRFLYRQFNLAS